jgi:hypothetical protein
MNNILRCWFEALETDKEYQCCGDTEVKKMQGLWMRGGTLGVMPSRVLDYLSLAIT